MRKQTAQSETATAVAALAAKRLELLALDRETTRSIIILEEDGIVATSTPDPRKDLEAAAHKLINGSAYEAAPSRSRNPAIELFDLRRRKQEIPFAIGLVEAQSRKATIDLGREIVAEHDAEIRELHHQRALTVASLLKLNDKIEAFRLRLLQTGGTVAHELDGYTPRLFGQSDPPSPANNWPRKYLELCIKAGVITKKEIEQ